MRYARILIQLGDIWGDHRGNDVDAEFMDQVQKLRGLGSLLVTLPSDARVAHARRMGGVSSDVTFATLASLRAEDLDATDEVVIACVGARASALRSVDRQLRASGFHRAGRSWGEAGDSRRYVRPRSGADRARAAAAEGTVLAGRAVVFVRDQLLRPTRLAAMARRVRAVLGIGLRREDVLDARLGDPMPHVPIMDVRELMPEVFAVDLPAWEVDLAGSDPSKAARACFDTHGVWPISFSFPGDPLPLVEAPMNLVAPVVPGLPYAFEDATDYYRTYQTSYLGLTHRKAGWDCFRHVEILASGAIPLMPDAQVIPEWCMVHYPKKALTRAYASASATGGPPSQRTRAEFREWFTRNLTSSSMARYILTTMGLDDDSRVLFVDEQLPRRVDYQSVLTLIGLKQILGARCETLFPVSYIYDDFPGDRSKLYGRGFGYTGVVSHELQPPSEVQSWKPSWREFDAVVIGSIARNQAVAELVGREFPATRTAWIHGEDTPPEPDDVARWRRSGSHLFVRAIHSGPTGGR